MSIRGILKSLSISIIYTKVRPKRGLVWHIVDVVNLHNIEH